MMTQLNPEQQQAVEHLHGPLLVLAGAGSGKTRVITEKIVHLIERCHYQPKQIIAVTFTNKAAKEMLERISQKLSRSVANQVRVSTFHTLGLNIIRREHQHLGLKAGFSILDTYDTNNLLKDILGQHHCNAPLDVVRHQISQWKNVGLVPGEALQKAEDKAEYDSAAIYQIYDQHLRAYNAVDFDDLILLPTRLFADNAEVRDRWQDSVRYLLVDEYQDTNETQYQLIKYLTGIRRAFTVVGDDDQSIYTWRGARPENLATLKTDFPNLAVIKLERNYRSTQHILQAANELIANNPHLFEKELRSQLGPGNEIRIVATENEQYEAEQVAVEIMANQLRTGTPFHHYAILYRSNHQARIIEAALRERNLPYQLSGGQSFFEKGEVKDVMAYLRLMVNPDDDPAFLRVVNTPKREIGAKTLEKLGHYAHQRDCSLLVAGTEVGLGQTLQGKGLDRIQQFCNWIVLMGDNAERGDAIGVIHEVLDKIDYRNWLNDSCNSPEMAQRKWDNIEELLRWIANLIEKNDDSLSQVIAKLILFDRLEKDSNSMDNMIQMMTLHAAKGLEFKHVYLVGVEEGLLPHQNSIDEDNLEEERRLTYVGITRAKQHLTISYAAKRKQAGMWMEREPSRFLDELPEDNISWSARKGQTSVEKQQKTGKEALGDLRSLLR